MSKIDEALEIIRAFGLPRAQQNERSALTLLALANLEPNDPWADTEKPLLRIWDIMGFMRQKYGKDCRVGRIYVTAFLSKVDFRKHAADIAWETEVWIAETPDHMIHFNGPKFLGPYQRGDTKAESAQRRRRLK